MEALGAVGGDWGEGLGGGLGSVTGLPLITPFLEPISGL